MKKITIALGCLIFCFLLSPIQPASAEPDYTPDAIITSVSFEPGSSQVSTNTSYTFIFTTGSIMPAYTTIYIFFYDSEGLLNPAEIDIDLTFGEYNSPNFIEDGYETGYRDGMPSVGFIQLTEEHKAGQYSFTIDNLTNPDDELSLIPVLSTDTWGSEMAVAVADELFVLSTEAETLDTSDTIASLAVEAETLDAGATGDLEFTIVTLKSLGYGDAFFLGFVNEDGDSPADTGFDFGSTSYISDMSLLCEPISDLNDAVYYCMAYSSVVSGTYDLTILNVTNPDVSGPYTALITMDSEISPTAEFITGNDLEIVSTVEEEEELSVPATPKKKNFEVKKKKKCSALLKWKSQSAATYYKLRLEKYKKKKKTYKKIKLYKNLTAKKKQIKKSKKILKAGTKYRFKMKACNSAGCSDWSKYKKFTTK